MAVDIAFWILAAVAVVSAVAVVVLNDVFRAAIFLILCFFTTAGLFVTLNADFLAAMQVLIYIGAVAILVIFAILFTRDVQHGNPSNKLKVPVLIAAVALLGVMISSAVTFGWPEPAYMANLTDTAEIGRELFSENGFVVPVQIAGIMLLAAAIGAMVLMREK